MNDKAEPMKGLEVSKAYWIAPFVIFIVFALTSLFFYERLPERIAVHFNSAGEPDNYSNKFSFTLGMLGAGGFFVALTTVILFVGKKYPMFFHKGKLGLGREDYLRFTTMGLIAGLLVMLLSYIGTLYYAFYEIFPPIWFLIWPVAIPILWLLLRYKQMGKFK